MNSKKAGKIRFHDKEMGVFWLNPGLSEYNSSGFLKEGLQSTGFGVNNGKSKCYKLIRQILIGWVGL